MAKSKTKATATTKSVPAPVPTMVKVIAVLEYYLGAAFLLFFALISFVVIVLSVFFEDVLQSVGFNTELDVAGAAISVGVGILFLALAVLSFYIGRGLWNGRNWARICVIVHMAIGIIYGSIIIANELFMSLFILAISALICGYFLFNQNVKAAFS